MDYVTLIESSSSTLFHIVVDEHIVVEGPILKSFEPILKSSEPFLMLSFGYCGWREIGEFLMGWKPP